MKKSEYSFGDILRKLRIERELTLREVAEELGTNISMLGKIEKNHRRPNKSLLRKISKLFNISDKELKISLHSDLIVYDVMKEKEIAHEVLKVAEKKIKYLKTKKLSNK